MNAFITQTRQAMMLLMDKDILKVVRLFEKEYGEKATKKVLADRASMMKWIFSTDDENLESSLRTAINMRLIPKAKVQKLEAIKSKVVLPEVRRVNVMVKAERERLVEEVTSLLKTLTDKYGLRLNASGYSYNEGGVYVKVGLEVLGEDGLNAADAKEWELFAKGLGLKLAWFGKTVVHPATGEKYKIIGMNRSSDKFPVRLKRLGDNKGVNAPVKFIVANVKDKSSSK